MISKLDVMILNKVTLFFGMLGTDPYICTPKTDKERW